MSSPDRGDQVELMDPAPPPRPTVLRRLTHGLEHARGLRGWIEAARASSPALDATFAAIERDSELGGNMLAGALAYRLFLFALPLAFFVVSGLGLLASTLGVNANLIVNSVGFTGVVTKQVVSGSKGPSSWWVALSSFFVLVYATTALLRAVTKVQSLAWEHSAVSGKVSRRSLGFFGLALAGQLALAVGWGAVNHQTAIGGIVTLVVVVLAVAGLWLLASLELPHSGARWPNLIAGSLFYGIGLVGVQIANVLILSRLMQEKSSTYGALGIAATILLGFFFVGRVIVGAAVLNATLYERHSRAAAAVDEASLPGVAPPRAAGG